MAFLLESLCGYSYGFRWLTVDDTALSQGLFRLSSAAGLFKDGMPFAFPGSDTIPEPYKLPRSRNRDFETYLISLAIPNYREGKMNVSFERSSPAATRYIADIAHRKDETAKNDQDQAGKDIQVANKNFSYLLDSNNQTGYSTLPVARITRNHDRFDIDRSFVPPLLHVGASAHLSQIVRTLANSLTDRSHELSEDRGLDSEYAVEALDDSMRFWLLYTVNSFYAAFRQYDWAADGAKPGMRNPQYPLSGSDAFSSFGSGAALHPNEVFAQMLALGGALSAFSPPFDATGFPSYNHDDPGPCFDMMARRIHELLNSAVPSRHIVLPLKASGDGVFSTFIRKALFTDSRFFLAIRSDSSPDELVRGARTNILVASVQDIWAVVRERGDGILLNRTSPLRKKDQAEYFQLITDEELWPGLRETGSLAVWVSDEIPNPKMDLHVLLKNPI